MALTDLQKKQIMADRVDGLSERKLAAKYHVSATTIHRVLHSNPEMARLVADKKRENTADILAYMDSKKDLVCQIIGEGLEVLADPRTLRDAKPHQITTALGTLIDKWTMFNGKNENGALEDILDAVRGVGND